LASSSEKLMELGDLETNPNSGAKECRYLKTLDEAKVSVFFLTLTIKGAYHMILTEKMGPKKGYQKVELFASNIGSEKVDISHI
jgi:uncharacterized Fe-S cluster-containing protein